MSLDQSRGEYESARESLDSVTLAEYKELPDDVKEWLQAGEEVPKAVLDILGEVDRSFSVRELMKQIRAALYAASGDKRSHPESFEESRFTSFAEVVERGLESCGTHTRAIGTTLRKLGVPVRFVDGVHTEGDKAHDHAWLDVYVPKTKSWIESDTRTETFDLGVGNKRKSVFHDWEELQRDGRE